MSELPLSDPYHQLRPIEQERYLCDLLLARTRTYLAQEALREVEPDDFADPMLAAIWSAARSLSSGGEMITMRALRGHVLLQLPPARDGRRDTQRLDQALERIMTAVAPVESAPEAIRTVREMGQMRRMYDAAKRMQQLIIEAPDPSVAMASITEEVDALDKTVVTDGPVLVGQDVDGFDEYMRGGPTAPVIPTPWEGFNDLCSGGLHGGRLYVVGGRPGAGKTNVGLVLAGQAAEEGTPSLVFSAEMSRMEVTGRWVARAAAIELSEIQRHDLSDWSWRRFDEFRQRAGDIPLWVDDKAGIGIPYIKTVARQMKRKHNIGLVAVDYLQLLRSENTRAQRYVQVGEMSRALKLLARELDIPVVVLAQLNRGSVDKTPTMSDLRESGDIEQDADTIILIEHPLGEDGKPTGMVNLHVPKNRHGRTGEIQLTWRAHRADIY